MLTTAAGRLPDKVEPREWLVEVYKHTSDSVHLPEALAALAAIYRTLGDLKRASQIYEEILARDPENESVRHEYDKLKGAVGNKEAGNQSFDQHLTELFQKQIIDVAEAKRLATNVDALNLALRGIGNSDTRLR